MAERSITSTLWYLLDLKQNIVNNSQSADLANANLWQLLNTQKQQGSDQATNPAQGSKPKGAIGCLQSFFGSLDAGVWGDLCRTMQCKNQFEHFVWLLTTNLAAFSEPLWSSCLDTCSLICSLTMVCLPHTTTGTSSSSRYCQTMARRSHHYADRHR
jgi:hypothetical protein